MAAYVNAQIKATRKGLQLFKEANDVYSLAPEIGTPGGTVTITGDAFFVAGTLPAKLFLPGSKGGDPHSGILESATYVGVKKGRIDRWLRRTTKDQSAHIEHTITATWGTGNFNIPLRKPEDVRKLIAEFKKTTPTLKTKP